MMNRNRNLLSERSIPSAPISSRRGFLKASLGSVAAAAWLRGLSWADAAPLPLGQDVAEPADELVRFGVITDVHHGLAPDALPRLQAFMAAVQQRDDLDFIIQMGDFCHPTDEARPVMDAWNQFEGPKYHVLGNHDMDKGSKSDIMKLWDMPRRYDSFDVGPFHFVILDFNNLRQRTAGQVTYTPYDSSNYYLDAQIRGWCDPEQLDWLARDLASTDKTTFVFSHQPLGMGNPFAELPPRQQEVLEIIHAANAKEQKVAVCLCGHMHVDRLERVNELHCLCVNSASYHWSGGMQPYADPLFGFVTLDPAGRFYLEGARSTFVNAHPWRQGLSLTNPGVTATISDRAIVYSQANA